MRDKKNDIGGPGWALIPPAIMMTTELNPREKLIWGRINGLIGVKGFCWASNESLGKQIQVKTNTMSDIISDMVKLGYMKRQLVYRCGKEEFIYDEKPSGEELKGKRYIERRLNPVIPERIIEEDKTDDSVCTVKKGHLPDEKRNKEFDCSIRKERKEEIYKEEKKEKRGIAASSPLKSKDSVTKPTNNNAIPLREYGQESKVIKSYQDMPGTRFGEIIVLESFGKVSDGKWDWMGLCPCGRRGVYSNEELLGEKPKVCICKLSAVEIMQRELDMFEEMRNPPPEQLEQLRISKEKRDSIKAAEEEYVRTYTEEDRVWKKAVHEKDNYTCLKCGRRSPELHAHHIDGYKNNEELRHELSNGATLCKKCHYKFHGIYGRGENTREQFTKFMEDKKEQE